MPNTALATTQREVTLYEVRPLSQNPAAVYLACLSEGSRRTMREALNTVAALLSNGQHDALSLPWADLRFQHTAAIRSQLAARYAFSTANKTLSAVRGTLKAAWRLGQMSAEDYARAVDVQNVAGERLPAGRSIAMGELVALLETCANDPTAAGARDGAILALLYSCGLRRAELVGLDLADYSATEGTLAVRHGKRNKQRIVPVVNGTAEALADWLTVRGVTPGPLFWSVMGAHRGGRLTTQAIYEMLLKRAGAAGVNDLSPHDFRRTFVSDLIDAGADVGTVQKLCGHANVATTLRYDRRPEAAKRKAVELLHVPYHRRRPAQSERR